MLAMLLILGLSTSVSAKPVVLKIATATPQNSSWGKAMMESAAEIKDKTDGRVVFKYYFGGVQGSDGQARKKIKRGILHGGAFTPSGINEEYADINLYSLPLVFESDEEAAYVRTLMDEKLIAGMAEKGLITFGFAHTGFAMVMSNEPVHGIDDLRGKKVWVPEGDQVSYDSMKALSVSPVPLPLTDVMTGLQTRLIDIAPVSPIGALFLQWYTKVKYVTDMPLVYTFGFLVIDERKWQEIETADQQTVRDVIAPMFARFDGSGATDNEGALAAIVDKGLQKVVPDAEEKARIRATMAASNRELANQGVVSVDLYEEMMAHIRAFREERSVANAASAGRGVIADE
jgi:TRAP-type C4-dicarboxylate transport system substrate-binding protein